MNLAEIKIGAEALVESVNGEERVAKRLMEMGIVPGVTVRVVKSAPFGDPIQIRLLGYNLAIRRNEAAAIAVTSI